MLRGDPAQSMPFMEQPREILVPLLPYQRQFLAWGVSQEQSSVRGGILADEMGMGKTLQVSLPHGLFSAGAYAQVDLPAGLGVLQGYRLQPGQGRMKFAPAGPCEGYCPVVACLRPALADAMGLGRNLE